MSSHLTLGALMGRAGVLMLLISPASLLSTVTQVVVALAAAFPFLLIYKQRYLSGVASFGVNQKPMLACMLIIFLFGMSTSILSMTELISTNEAPMMEVFGRSGGQQLALMLSFLQVVCGYHMAISFSDHALRRVIILSFVVISLVAAYQVVAIKLGLPYVGKFVDDKFVGLRPTSLANEPKYLSGYLACMLYYLFFLFFEARFTGRLWILVALVAALSFFIQAASANGFIAVFLLAVLLLLTQRMRWSFLIYAVLTVAIGMALLSVAAIDLDALNLRGTHKDILENISSIDLTLFDDLIALPLLAWMENPWKSFVGFGPGLMHFFARRFIDQATWLTDETYIEGNVSFLMYASNLGVFVYFLLLLFLGRCAIALVRTPPEGTSRSTALFFASVFTAGAIVSGNQSIPLFLAIGWILAKRQQNGFCGKSG